MKFLLKKPLAVLLSVMLLLTAVPFAATAATVDEAAQSVGVSSGTTGDCTWTLGDNGTLTISGNGVMGDYFLKNSDDTYITTAPWGANIKTIVIEDGVASIGGFAFYGCTGLTSIIIPDSVTKVCDSAFEGCAGLTSVTLGNSVMIIGDYGFCGCTSLKNITIPNSVTSIGEWAFSNCYSLTGVTIPGSVTSIGKAAFSGCSDLKSVTIPDSVTSIGEFAFFGCTGLTSVTIPDSVTSIGECAFGGCTGLTSVTIPDSVTSIGSEAFSGCTGLTNVAIPDSVTSIGESAFYGCTDLTSVTISSKVKSIGYSAFYGCIELTSVTIPDSVTNIGSEAFFGCICLASVTIPDSVTSIGYNALGYYDNNDYRKVAGFTICGKQGSEAQRYANINGFIFEEVATEEPTTEEPSQPATEPAIPGSLTLTATSNISPESTTRFSSARLAEKNNYVTVSYCVQSELKLVNCDWLLTYDGTVLQFDEEANTTGEGRNAKLDVMPSVSDEFVDINPTSVEYGLRGNCTSLDAYYLDNENGGRVAFVTVTFKVIGSGSTTVDLNVNDMRLTNKMWGQSSVDYETQAVLNGTVMTDALPDFDTRVYLGQYNEEYIENPETPTEPTEEPTIDPDTILDYSSVYAVGNGKGTWLNGISWRPYAASNKMTEVAEDVWEIKYSNVPAGNGYQVRFAIDGAWTHSFGGTFERSGAVSEAVYDGDNITFDTDDICTVKATLDLRNFDYATKEGAKFKIDIIYEGEEYTTVPYEETTATAEEGTTEEFLDVTTTPAEEGTTAGYEETTAPAEEGTTAGYEETTAPASTDSLIINATSNLFPKTVNAYNNLSEFEDENGDVFITIEYMLAAPGQYLINLDVEELSWDPAVLEFKEAYNKMGTGRQAKFTIFPFAYEQGLGAGMVNTFGDNNGGRLVGNYTSVQPAAYATEEDDVSPVTVVRAVFKVLDREAGVTTVDCLIDALALCDDTIAEPYVQHRLVYNGVVNDDILSNCYIETINAPAGQVEPPVEETTTPEETTEAVEETTEAYEETTAPAEEGTTEYYEATTCAPEYCTVSGISNYCPAVEAQEVEVGDQYVMVTFVAPEDRDLVDIQWGMNYDKDMLELTGISTFDGGSMLINIDADTYNVVGSLTDIYYPYSLTQGDMFITFAFKAKQAGETTVDLCVVDMMVRIDGEDYIRVEDGEIKTICTHNNTRTIPGHSATCTEEGLTDEIVCADCGKVLTQAEAIPALGHVPVIDAYLAPTCSHEGHTAGSHCERCGEVFIQPEPIAKLPHTVVTDEAVEPSCSHTGLTEGSHCSVCGEVIVEQEVIPALKHQYEIVPAVPATYTKEGSTDGVRCKRCGEWLIEPQVVPKKPIDFTFGDVNEDGKVNIRDVTAIQRFLAEYTDLTERQRGAADVNFDGVVDVRDATLLQMYFAEFDVTLG